MNIQIYAAKKNFDCQKAERWFKERNVKFQSVDLTKKPLSPREYESVRAQVGVRGMIDTASKAYPESTLKYISGESALRDELFFHQSLLKTPIVRNGRLATVGYQPEVWEKWMQAE